MSSLEVGQKFPSVASAKQAINEYIVNQGRSYRTYKSDPKRCWVPVCRQAKEQSCTSRIRLSIRKNEDIELSVLEPHTCPHSVQHNFRLPNSVKMISSNARNLALITDDPTTKAKHIANNEHIDRGSRIPYLQGHRAAEYLKTHVFGDPSLSFQKIPGLMQAFEGIYIGSRCRTAHTKYEIDPITHQFHRAWVLPTATQEAYSHCRNFVAMDGTHMKDLYRMTILALVTLDGNNQIVPLFRAIVPTEDYENWRWFLRKVARYIPLDEEDSVIMSDRGKGLVTAVDEIYPNALLGYYCQHLAKNVEAHGFSKECKQLFWCAAFAESEAAFDAVFVKIRAEDPNCYDYLRNIPAERWATYTFPRPRYGHLTSNIQESVNSS